MPAKTLSRLAIETCIANVRKIDDVGDVPYHVIRPVLLKVDNPQQLRDLEKNSPQICGADAELWRGFCKRDIRNWHNRQIEPKNPQNWHKVYRKLQKEDEDRSRQALEKLKADMESRNAEKQSNQMGFVDRVINPVQKAGPRQRTTADRSANMSSLRFGSGSRTSAATGQSTMNKVKRQTREASHFGRQKTVLSTPTHLLNKNVTHGRIVGPKTMAATTSQLPAAIGPTSAIKTTGASATTSSVTRVPMHATSSSPARPSPLKRAAASVFMPSKKRKV